MKPFSHHFPTVARILTGLPLCIFGLNAFFKFIPQPPAPLPSGAAAFLGALVQTGYMVPLIGATHFVVGAMLLANRFVPLALVLLAPFLANSVAFHLFLEPSGLVMALIFLALELYLAWIHRAAYLSLFAARLPS